MFGSGDYQLFEEVVQAVDSWIPSKEYNRESKFQNELQEFLDTELNSQTGGMLGFGGDGRDRVVERESGRARADIVVDQTVAIEMKRELTNSQTKKLRGQIEEYLDDYSYVIICACGIQDMDGWRRLKNKYQAGEMGLGMDTNEVVFIEKDPANYGQELRQNDDLQDPFSDLSF